MVNRFITTVLAVFVVCFNVCAQNENGKSSGLKPVKTYYPNGNIETEAWEWDSLWQGKSKTYYENGQLESENFWKDDIQTGPSKTWFSNGKLKCTGQFEDGLSTGEWKYYDDISGKFIYSVTRERDTATGYTFSKDKYLWRNVNQKSQGICFDFPCRVMDSMKEKALSVYWTAYPRIRKEDFEFYVVNIITLAADSDVALFRKILTGLKQEYSDRIQALFNSSGTPDAPDMAKDEFQISDTRKRSIDGDDAYEVQVFFPKVKVRIHALFVFSKNRVYYISAWLNRSVPEEVESRFFSSIKLYQ